ncbi:MAG: mannitol-1-phosphate 5-dehydrogenase [Planctomycetes bacterium]|nr:mannitol-1-phosphate 5-dehydrogenase [Planctomycetota bacterium]
MADFVQFGAGNIGRSLAGALMSRAGYNVIFVDLDRRLVDALNTAGSYRIVVKDECPEEIVVSGVRAVGAWDRQAVARSVADADFAGTAVGPRALEAVADLFAEGLRLRNGRPIDLLLCENQRGAASLFRACLRKSPAWDASADWPVGLVETSIGKMVPIMPADVREADPTLVWAEAYNRIIADREAFITPIPDVDGLVTKSNFSAYVDRKLYVHNLGHAACAYFGALHGADAIWESMEIPDARDAARGSMNESGNGLLSRYPGEWSRGEMLAHIEDLLKRFRNRALGDTVFRVGRDLPRKLRPDDRLIGSLRMQLAAGVDPAWTVRAVAAALLFRKPGEDGRLFPQDASFVDFIAENGPAAALCKFARMDVDRADAEICRRIMDVYRELGGIS